MQEQFWKYLNGIAMKYSAIEVEQLEFKWKFLFLLLAKGVCHG